MALLDYLKIHWRYFGLDAPAFTWIVSAILPVVVFLVLARLWWVTRREGRAYREAIIAIVAAKKQVVRGPKEGLTLGSYSALRKILERRDSLSTAAFDYDAHTILRRNSRGDDEIWASRSATMSFSDERLIDDVINRAFYSSIPGLVTGVGLLFTFLAILVALLDVNVQSDNQVSGLNLLIQGLSGKFLSSIAALTSATLYLLFEKPLFHRLARSRAALAHTIDSLVPILSSPQILADVSRDIGEQSAAFRSFNADLSQKLRSSFNESMGPTIDRMVTSIETLNEFLRAAEAQKQDSITGSLEALLQKLQDSMDKCLQDMGTKFRDSISGSAMSEFDKAAASMSGTATLLEKMNSQFMATQAGLSELVDFAKSSTAQQFEMGRTQVQELTDVLRGLMVQINESAGSSVNNMASTLTAVVHDLSVKVSDLGNKMAESIQSSAGMATGVAGDVIARAEKWSDRSAEQLAQLLESHQQQLGTVKELRAALEESLVRFRQVLNDYATLTRSVESLMAQANTAVTALSGSAKSIKDTQDSMQRVASLSSTQIEQFTNAAEEQESLWKRIEVSMQRYREVFAQVEKEAGSLLDEINGHLTKYVQTTERGFQRLVQASDEHFANATSKLGNSVGVLDETLETLTETLEKLSRRNGNPR